MGSNRKNNRKKKEKKSNCITITTSAHEVITSTNKEKESNCNNITTSAHEADTSKQKTEEIENLPGYKHSQKFNQKHESIRNTITTSTHKAEASTSKQKVDESKGRIDKVSTVSSSTVKPLCNLEDVICDSQSSSSSNLHAKIRGKIEVDESKGSINKVSAASSSAVKPPCNLEDVICDSQSSSSSNLHTKNGGQIEPTPPRNWLDSHVVFDTIFQRNLNIVKHCQKCSCCQQHLQPVLEWGRGARVEGCHLEGLVKAFSTDSRNVSGYGNEDHLVILKKVLGEIKLTEHDRLTSVAVSFIKDIVWQLGELHASGRTYGNLKPQNIFIIREVRRISAKLSNTSSGNDGQRQRRMDENMLDLGCVLFFLITDGKHPRFGGYRDNKVENLSLVKDPEARDLISRLLEPYPTLRPKAREVLCFPPLWKRESRIGFLRVIKSLMFKYPYLMNELKKITLVDIGANREGKPVGGWDETMPAEFIDHMLTYQSTEKEKNQTLKFQSKKKEKKSDAQRRY